MKFVRILNTLLPALVVAVSLPAQKPADLFAKAPPDVDEALRSRVTTFYQAHVDGKPRKAEEVVAEDSKDYFYNSRKPNYISFEINSIKYSDNFTKATVVTVIETMVPLMSLGNKAMKVPLSSFWKIEEGHWCWYVDADKLNMTPFGKMGTPPNVSKAGNGSLPDLAQTPDVAAVLKQVSVDKAALTFKSGVSSSQEAVITNSMKGSVMLALPDRPVPGIEVNLSKTQLAAGEKCTVTIRYTPGSVRLRSFPLNVEVKPLNTYLTVRLQFQ